MKKILAIGELLWDLLPDSRKLGGAPANFAFRLKEMGHQVLMVSRVGNDAMGREAVEMLQSAGLDISLIQTDNFHPTGTVEVFFDDMKNPDYHINSDVAYDYLSTTGDLLNKATTMDCIAYGTLAQRNETSRNTIQTLLKAAENTLKFCDINLRKACYSTESVAVSMHMADIVKLNHNELDELTLLFSLNQHDEIAAAQELVNHFDLQMCLVTFESYGAMAVSALGEIIYSPGYKIQLEDSLGAGDAFSAAFVHHLLTASSIAQALNSGNYHGAMVARQKGAMQPLGLQLTIKDGLERVVKASLADYRVLT